MALVQKKDMLFLGLLHTVQRYLEIKQPFGACPRVTLVSKKRPQIGFLASHRSHGFHNLWNKSFFCLRFALASHFFWGLWSIIQARLSTIEFGYLVSLCLIIFKPINMHCFLESKFVNCNKVDCTRKGAKHFINKTLFRINMVTAMLSDNPEQSPHVYQFRVAWQGGMSKKGDKVHADMAAVHIFIK